MIKVSKKYTVPVLHGRRNMLRSMIRQSVDHPSIDSKTLIKNLFSKSDQKKTKPGSYQPQLFKDVLVTGNLKKKDTT